MVVVWFIWLDRAFEQAPERAQEYAYHDYCATVNAINAFLFLFRGLFDFTAQNFSAACCLVYRKSC